MTCEWEELVGVFFLLALSPILESAFQNRMNFELCSSVYVEFIYSANGVAFSIKCLEKKKSFKKRRYAAIVVPSEYFAQFEQCGFSVVEIKHVRTSNLVLSLIGISFLMTTI